MATKRQTFSTVVYILSFLFLSGAEARATAKQRIARHAPSLILDTCAYVESPRSQFFGSLSGTNPFCSAGDDSDTTVQACLCTSEVKAFIQFSGLTIGDMNSTELEWAAEEYIANSPGAKQCSYPPNSTPKCSRDDPCGYECSNGFERRFFTLWGETKSTCTCPLPNIVCGGQCGSFPNGCPESKATPEGALWVASGTSPSAAFVSSAPSSADPTYSAQAQHAQDAGCAPQETLCGVYAPRGRTKTECVDTRNALESCGGCMVPPPSPFDAYDNDGQYKRRDIASGVDCSTMEAAADVICSAGRCLVRECEIGWMVAPSGDHCVPDDFSNAAIPEEKSGDEWYAPHSMPHLQLVSSTSASPTSTTSGAETLTETPSPPSAAPEAETSSETPSPLSTSSDFAVPDPTSSSQVSPTSDLASPTPDSGEPVVTHTPTDAENDEIAENNTTPNSNSDPDPGAGEDAPEPGTATPEDQDGGNDTGEIRLRLGTGRFQSGSSDDTDVIVMPCGNQRRDVVVDANACLSLSAAIGTTTSPIVSASAAVDGSVSTTQAPDAIPTSVSASVSDAPTGGAETSEPGPTPNAAGNGNSSCGNRRRDANVDAGVCESASAAVGGDATSALENPSLPTSTDSTPLPGIDAVASVDASASVVESIIPTSTTVSATTSVTDLVGIVPRNT